VSEFSLGVSFISLLLALVAFIRAGRNYVEEQRDKLLAQITALATEAWQRDSELVAVEHLHAGASEEIQRSSHDVLASTRILREALRTQIGEFDSRFEAVTGARGLSARALFIRQRIDMYRQTPLLAAQNRDVAEHIFRSTKRLDAAGS